MNTTHTVTEAVRVQAHYGVTKKLGNWTDANAFEVKARRGHAVLDLRSPQIPDGDIEVRVDLDHGMLKLLVPEGAVIDHWDLTIIGRGRVKDWTGQAAVDGRRIHITGEVRHGEIRVHRGGIAMLSAMFSRNYVNDVRRAHADGTFPTVDDPSRIA
ncbi:hypothetical protein F0L68_09110 [Solihabitans fulvus]|uniref:Uncharacterized protein n=1 Tax=Solihabitans fulvus TaxID=1892852 RepID=A0A5B2XLM9_9PSEU|nr:hypothetical protein [Solihabitans fulvus]KAA2263819.1 hypothetical protein F0L68_09110 [Solihabitans fulvus]